MKYLFCNWKMYLNVADSVALAQEIGAMAAGTAKIVLFPTYPAIPSVVWACQGSTIAVGAQDCHWVPSGAYTGAVGAPILKSAGCEYVLVGHSERRHIFGEGDTGVRKKIEAALDAGLVPVLCIGETKEEKDNGKREYRLKKQIMTALGDLDLRGGRIMAAYEPVWAIGTGEACLPADVDDIHGWIQLEIKQYLPEAVPILYGGSVNADSVASYVQLPNVAGVLVGSASAKLATLSPLLQVLTSI